jgi:uncharacterized membrane protein
MHAWRDTPYVSFECVWFGEDDRQRHKPRNYVWMFLIVLIAWLLKIRTPKLMPDGTPGHFAHSLAEWATGATIGPVPGWAVVLVVAAFYCWIIYTAFRRYAGEGELSIGDVHV